MITSNPAKPIKPGACACNRSEEVHDAEYQAAELGSRSDRIPIDVVRILRMGIVVDSGITRVEQRPRRQAVAVAGLPVCSLGVGTLHQAADLRSGRSATLAFAGTAVEQVDLA